MVIRCSECAKPIFDQSDKWNAWIAVYHYFEHELCEEEITQATFDAMVGRLMLFKESAMADAAAKGESDG